MLHIANVFDALRKLAFSGCSAVVIKHAVTGKIFGNFSVGDCKALLNRNLKPKPTGEAAAAMETEPGATTPTPTNTPTTTTLAHVCTPSASTETAVGGAGSDECALFASKLSMSVEDYLTQFHPTSLQVCQWAAFFFHMLTTFRSF